MRRLFLPVVAAFLCGFVLAACGPSAAQVYCAKIKGMAQSHQDSLATTISCQAALDAEQTRETVAMSAGVAAGMAGAAIGSRR